MIGGRLVGVGGSHLFGSSQGHHGLQIVILVVIVVVIAVGVVLVVRRAWARRPSAQSTVPAADAGAVPATGATGLQDEAPLAVVSPKPARAPWSPMNNT